MPADDCRQGPRPRGRPARLARALDRGAADARRTRRCRGVAAPLPGERPSGHREPVRRARARQRGADRVAVRLLGERGADDQRTALRRVTHPPRARSARRPGAAASRASSCWGPTAGSSRRSPGTPPAIERVIRSRPAFVRTVLAGGPFALSDVIAGPEGRNTIQFALPFAMRDGPARAGQRRLAATALRLHRRLPRGDPRHRRRTCIRARRTGRRRRGPEGRRPGRGCR